MIDDILVYRQPYGYYLVCNASNRADVVAQLEQHRAGADGNFRDRTRDTAMIAVQGPRALETLQPLFDQPLEPVPYYHLTMGRLLGKRQRGDQPDRLHGRRRLRADRRGQSGRARLGRAPGIGPEPRHPPVRPGRPRHAAARGRDAALRPRAVRVDQPVRGRAWAGPSSSTRASSSAARRCAAGSGHPGRTRVGLRLEGKRIARQGATVLAGDREVGAVTSGTFSPTLQVSLAMALVDPCRARPAQR